MLCPAVRCCNVCLPCRQSWGLKSHSWSPRGNQADCHTATDLTAVQSAPADRVALQRGSAWSAAPKPKPKPKPQVPSCPCVASVFACIEGQSWSELVRALSVPLVTRTGQARHRPPQGVQPLLETGRGFWRCWDGRHWLGVRHEITRKKIHRHSWSLSSVVRRCLSSWCSYLIDDGEGQQWQCGGGDPWSRRGSQHAESRPDRPFFYIKTYYCIFFFFFAPLTSAFFAV